MSDEIELKVDTRELEAALKALPAKLRGAAMREALTAAGNVMLEAIVAHTPERTDEETPDSTALPPGILKADMHIEVRMGAGDSLPRVKVGPSQIAGRVARWQNNGYTLTRGLRKSKYHRNATGKEIKAIPGKHFIEAGFDESAETAVDMFLAVLGDQLFGTGAEDEGATPENKSLDVEFD